MEDMQRHMNTQAVIIAVEIIMMTDCTGLRAMSSFAAGQLVATKLNLLVSTGLANVSGYVTVGTGTIDAADYAAI